MTDTPEDIEREQFLMRLLRSGVPTTLWEHEFMESALKCAQATYFTDRMREKIDQMRKSYEHQISDSGTHRAL